jgi:beta-glucoside operon transcriptional antiterminator
MSDVKQVFQARFELLLSSGLANQASISAALDTLNQVEQHTGIILDEALGAPLATHLAVTLKRLLQGDVLQPAPEVLWEELRDYPAQLDLASALIARLKQRLGIQIPSDEAGFIALHLARIALTGGDPVKTSNPATQEEG